MSMTVATEAQKTNSQLALAGPTEANMRPERKLSDSFWMYTYKVELCPKKEFHDWEKCAYAHPGERARRRHPSKYQAVQCPEARAKKVCPRGMDCPCTHHLFEYWLHPDRYLTCLCELGPACNRPICFFAHTEDELRPLPPGLSVAAQPPAPPPHKVQQNRSAAAASNSSTPTHSLVPDLVASFNQALAMQELRSSSISPAAGLSQVSATGSDKSGNSSVAPAGPGSGVQLLIEQMANTDSSPGSTAFAALDDLAADKASKHAAPCSKSPSPLAVVVAAPNPSDIQRSNSGLVNGSPSALMSGSPPVVATAAGQAHPLQQLAQQQQLGRGNWQGTYPAAAASSASSSGTLPVLQATQPSAHALQVNLQAHLRQLQQQGLLHQGSGANTNCSSPLALAGSSPMGFTLGSTSPVAGISPRSVTSGMDAYSLQQQQQQQARGMMGVMSAAVSLGRLSPNLLAQQQQYVQVQQGGAGYAVISMPAVEHPQMVPLQAFDDPAEHLSFSLWGDAAAAAACYPAAQQQLLQQNQPFTVPQQQQQLQLLQQRQQLLQFQQQQNLQRQLQLQQMQQAAVSAPVMGGGGMGGMQPNLGLGMQPNLGLLQNQGLQAQNLMNGLAQVNPGLMSSQGVDNVGSTGFEGFQALDLLSQQQQQQVLLMPHLHQAFGAGHNLN